MQIKSYCSFFYHYPAFISQRRLWKSIAFTLEHDCVFCAIEVAIFEKYSFHSTFYDLFLLSSQVSLIWRRCIWRRNAIKEDSTARQLIFFRGINFLSKHSLWQLISVVNQLKHWDFFSESSFCHFSCFLSLAFRWTCDEF